MPIETATTDVSMGIIIDTSLLIASERGRFDLTAFLLAQGASPVAISAITASEMLHCIERATNPHIRERRSRFVEALLSQFPVAPFGLPEARCHARIWADLLVRGLPIGPHDLLIAATALGLGFSVATLNQDEFRQVAGMHLLSVEGFALPRT